MVYDELGVSKMRELRLNFEEIELQGTESKTDVRRVNSYPSKVICFYSHVKIGVCLCPVLHANCLDFAHVCIPLSLHKPFL